MTWRILDSRLLPRFPGGGTGTGGGLARAARPASHDREEDVLVAGEIEPSIGLRPQISGIDTLIDVSTDRANQPRTDFSDDIAVRRTDRGIADVVVRRRHSPLWTCTPDRRPAARSSRPYAQYGTAPSLSRRARRAGGHTPDAAASNRERVEARRSHDPRDEHLISGVVVLIRPALELLWRDLDPDAGSVVVLKYRCRSGIRLRQRRTSGPPAPELRLGDDGDRGAEGLRPGLWSRADDRGRACRPPERRQRRSDRRLCGTVDDAVNGEPPPCLERSYASVLGPKSPSSLRG